MKTLAPFSSSSVEPAFAWFELGVKFNEMLWASSQVIAHRTELMRKAGAAPSAADQREMLLMGSEKVAAFSKSSQRTLQGLTKAGPGAVFDAGLRLMRATAPAMALMTSTTWPQWMARQAQLWRAVTPGPRSAQKLSKQMLSLSSQALAPVHATATANARRLSAQQRQRKK